MGRLEGKVAIITGAASGIGAGTAELFAEEGARLVLVDRDAEPLAAIGERLATIAPGVRTVTGDVALRETAESAVSAAVDGFGQLDIVFNNAGVMTSGDFRQTDEPAWDLVLDINLRGIYLFCHAAIPVMLKQGKGSIVNTSSVMATLTEPGYEAYTTSKAGIIGLTKALAVSYADQGIRVNCICPGWIDTPMNQRLAEELGGIDNLIPIIKRQQPLPRMISTREVGYAVLFLASDEASAITGAALYIDGAASAAI
jgi:NAD(P)-dependent dehydrogenase (short-subunit alcohol dehydrogenase family)